MKGCPHQKQNLADCNCSYEPCARKGGVNRLPLWFRQELPAKETFDIARILSATGVHTVCQEARCPNIGACFGNKEVTFLILGDTCTRNCRFCAVKKADQALYLDKDEPVRIARAVQKLKLNYVVITSVTRDDLDDGGAAVFARTIALIRNIDQDIKIEALIPDFKGNISSIQRLTDAGPDVLAHNLETAKSLYKQIRPLADYGLSLSILARIKEFAPGTITKSSLMLGLGEAEEEVIETMQDLRRMQCDVLTLGQYLAPSDSHFPIKEFITLKQFVRYADLGYNLGFKKVMSSPVARSSFRAEDIYREVVYV